jgi:hypothetical protein
MFASSSRHVRAAIYEFDTRRVRGVPEDDGDYVDGADSGRGQCAGHGRGGGSGSATARAIAAS